MTYEEAYMNCESKEEFRIKVISDTTYATLFNKDRLEPIRDAINKVAQAHPDWFDEEGNR